MRIRHSVFWAPFFLLLIAVVLSLTFKEAFLSDLTAANDWILSQFSWLFSSAVLLMMLTCLLVLLTPIGKVKIGGREAKPILNRWRLFSIILCTTIAVGILFWGTAEPIYHLMAPPESLGIEPGSQDAARFAISTMFLHWSFAPYAIYTVPAVMFALAYYNRKGSFSIGATLFPLVRNQKRWYGSLIDNICLYALVLGMSASLGAGVLTLAGGGKYFLDYTTTPLVIGIICILVVSAFVLSAVSGLLKGIRILSGINTVIFLLIMLFLFMAGPSEVIIESAISGITDFSGNILKKAMMSVIYPDDTWPQNWTVFYWANWLAWAPISALFLGRISYGYTVREFTFFCWILPSIFAIIWMSVFSGTALEYEMSGKVDLIGALENNGPESIIYDVLKQIPLSPIIIGVFIITTFLSYVTAADSNTEAMSGISSTGITPESPEPPLFIKVIWGFMIGIVAWIMVSYSGVDGVKMLSNLGGFPALFLLILINIGLIIIMIRPKKYFGEST